MDFSIASNHKSLTWKTSVIYVNKNNMKESCSSCPPRDEEKYHFVSFRILLKSLNDCKYFRTFSSEKGKK